MSSWSDPAICVAIILGVAANVWHAINLCRTQKEKRNALLWEEYRTTVVDAMRGALKDLLGPARYLAVASRSDTRPNTAEWKKFRDNLALLLNAVELICAKADRHPETIGQDWSELADRENGRILDLVGGDIAECDLESVRKQLVSYGHVFEDRLREQWRAMTGIASGGLCARLKRFLGGRRGSN